MRPLDIEVSVSSLTVPMTPVADSLGCSSASGFAGRCTWMGLFFRIGPLRPIQVQIPLRDLPRDCRTAVHRGV